VEREPNDNAGTAVTLNAGRQTSSGWIDRRNDRDWYAFTAKEKQVIRLEVLARRIGSRLDAVLRVLDSAGKELAKNDDAIAQDSRLLFTAPTAGTYYAEVTSVSGRGDDDFRYLLEIGDPLPAGFSLTVAPDNPTAPAGAAVPVTVTASRSGYNGEISLRVEGLPAGVSASPAVIPAGKNSTLLTLSAPSGASPAFGSIRIVGTAKIDDRTVEAVAQPEELYQPPLTNQPDQRRTRPTELFIAAVGAPPRFTLTAPATLEVKAGEKVETTLKLARTPMFKGKVAITVLGLPANVTVSALTIDEKSSEGKITLTAAKNAVVGAAPLSFQGASEGISVSTPVVLLTLHPAK
jgi:hypothetical protein